MTPKEKAEELLEKMLNGFQFTIDEYTAKKNALIAVDETQQLIKNLSSCKNRFIYIVDEMNYWQEVKSEIERL